MRHLAAFLLIGAVVGACSTDLPTDSTDAAPLAKNNNLTTRKIEWRLTYSLSKIADVIPGLQWKNGLSGMNIETHVGKTTGVGTSIVTLLGLQGPGTLPDGQWTGNPWGKNPVEATLTAANGDELYLQTEGYWYLKSANPVVNYTVGTWKFVGGTGRFEGAGGEGTYAGWQYGGSDDPDNYSDVVFTGTLIY